MDLLIFAINNSNEEFIKKACRKKIFDSEILHEPKMIEFYLKVLKQGNQTELMLNIFNFLDYKLWPKTDNAKLVHEFIDFASEIIDPDKEQNLMFLCYNPLLAICLFCENLRRVGDAIAFFKNACTGISSNL